MIGATNDSLLGLPGLPNPGGDLDGGGGDNVTVVQGSWGTGSQPADDRAVNYVFPVEVVVVGALTDDDRRGIYQQVWTDLGDAMAYQNA
jgi:hypothetical protein